MIGWLLCLLLPSALWAAGRGLAERRAPAPGFPLDALAGFLGAAGALAWAGRPFPEQLAGWVVGVIAWAGVFVIRDGGVFAAFGLVGAVWSALLGLQRQRAASPAAPGDAAARPAPAPPPVPAPPPEAAPDERAGFAMELRCPTCGAAIAVPVYHRMARCGFCASEHVVVRGGDSLTVVIPDAVTGEPALKAAVVAHLRQRRYLELYDTRVRPLVRGPEFVLEGGEPGRTVIGPARDAALADAAEARVAAAADAWAAGVAPRVEIRSWKRFLGPNWHGLGTLYQAAFGRGPDGGKRMEFAVATLEATVPASAAPLPEMGRLSYLRALRPLLGSPESELPALPVERGPETLDARMQRFSQRTSELEITPIARHATFVPEVVALVYRPWHVAEAALDGDVFTVLVDGGSGRVEGPAPNAGVDRARPEPRPAATPSLAPSRCPECAADLPFAPDAVAVLCRNCFRLVEMRGGRWASIPYLRTEPGAGTRTLAFWRFPLRLRAADGAVVTDLPHLTDGIDGTYDQIGDVPQTAGHFFVPAFRTRVSGAGVRLYRRLWPEVQGRAFDLTGERYTADRPPGEALHPTLPASEARAFARVYLALAFTPRDLARAQVKRVREAFLSAELEGEPELAFLPLPEELIGPFEGLLGRPRLTAIEALEGDTDAEPGSIRPPASPASN